MNNPSNPGFLSRNKWWFIGGGVILFLIIAIVVGLIVGYNTSWFGLANSSKLPKPNKKMTEVAAAYRTKAENSGFVNDPTAPFENIKNADIYGRFGYRAVRIPTGSTEVSPKDASDIRWNDKVYIIQLKDDNVHNKLTFKIPIPDPTETKLLATDVKFQLVSDYYSDAQGKGTKLNTGGVVVHQTIVMDTDGVEVSETNNTSSTSTEFSVNPTLIPTA